MSVAISNVHEGRWGFHSCSYDDFLKLKQAHKLLLRAYKDIKAWDRWDRKRPENRRGSEPKHPSWLKKYGYHNLPKGTYYGYGFESYNGKNFYLHVLKQYQIARKPMDNPEDVQSLDLPENLDEIVRKLEAFYAN